ncbi:MAG: alkaline phosphatase family protein [Gemmatimonadaceae bacterium]
MPNRHARIAMLSLAAGLTLAAVPPLLAQQRAPRTQNVVLVVTDGLRWQEVFTGADSLLLFGDPRLVGGDTTRFRARFWRATPKERRETLLPFMWSAVATQGQIFGNRLSGSSVVVSNGLKFSYPGYNEMIAGFADPKIDRNDYGPNPNLTVFEWLNRQASFRGKVSAIATWDAFADIFARRTSGVYVHAGWEPPYPAPRSALDSVLNRMYATTFRMWDNNAYDAFTQTVLLRHLASQRPRVVFVGYGETDEWAHAGRYDRTLNSAQAVDRYIAELWALIQATPQYRDRTTLIITTDHGRGRTPADWTNHGQRVDGAEEMWIAVIGPDTRPLGERRNVAELTQAQIAATIAALLGLDYRRDAPRAAGAIAEVLRP